MTHDLALEAAGLTKTYGPTPVLLGTDLRVARGGVFALLGPNGAGKTTTVRILATLLRATGGQARVAGYDVATQRREVRRRIGLTGQYAALDEAQTGAENLRMMARLAHLPRRERRDRVAGLLERFDLAGAADRRVATYSGGMRRRLDLAAGLLTEPEVLFLDEPTTGLDPRSRAAVWDVVADLAGRGVTVFLTTQYLEEADRLADRIAVLDAGRIVAEGTSDELKARVAGRRLDVTLAGPDAFDHLARVLGSRAVRTDRAALTLGLASGGEAAEVRALLDELDPGRDTITEFAVHAASLDDVFMTLTGRPSETAGPRATTDAETHPSPATATAAATTEITEEPARV